MRQLNMHWRGPSLNTILPSQLTNYVNMLKFSKLLFSRKKICKGKIGIYWNTLLCTMDSWKLINYSMDMCWSCPSAHRRIQVGKRNSCSRSGEPECTQGAQVFSLLGEGGGVGFLNLSHCVPVKFTMGSQHVPNSSSLYPISFAISFTLVTYITSPKEEHTTYLFRDYPKVDLFFCDSPIKDAHHARWGRHNYLNWVTV